MSIDKITINDFILYLYNLKYELIENKDVEVLSEPFMQSLIDNSLYFENNETIGKYGKDVNDQLDSLKNKFPNIFNILKNAIEKNGNFGTLSIEEFSFDLYNTMENLKIEISKEKFFNYAFFKDTTSEISFIKSLLRIIKYKFTIFEIERYRDSIFYSKSLLNIIIEDNALNPVDWKFIDRATMFDSKPIICSFLAPILKTNASDLNDFNVIGVNAPAFIFTPKAYEYIITNYKNRYIYKSDKNMIFDWHYTRNLNVLYVDDNINNSVTTPDLTELFYLLKEVKKSKIFEDVNFIYSINFIDSRAYGYKIEIKIFIFRKNFKQGKYTLSSYIYASRIKDINSTIFYSDFIDGIIVKSILDAILNYYYKKYEIKIENPDFSNLSSFRKNIIDTLINVKDNFQIKFKNKDFNTPNIIVNVE